MATSSITKNFVLRGEEVDGFIRLLESEPIPIPPSGAEMVSDPKIIDEILEKWEKAVEVGK